MAAFNKQCDVTQGYNLQRDAQVPVGYITKLKIGNVDLAADQKVTTPAEGHAQKKVVAVLSALEWEGGQAQPINMTGNVSTANKQKISSLLHKDLAKTEVRIQMEVWEYDPLAKVYFKSFHTNDADLIALLAKEGETLKLEVQDTPATDVVSPQNYEFTIGIMPVEQEFNIHLATGDQMPVVKLWGVAVG
ncbi:MAG: hypothetical protein KatS3mg102_0127 [Planctomycetota bacterium]|nr:MAG: hypothetical protein KatS3mg102_0127 [Planctomycetota bacterium]